MNRTIPCSPTDVRHGISELYHYFDSQKDVYPYGLCAISQSSAPAIGEALDGEYTPYQLVLFQPTGFM